MWRVWLTFSNELQTFTVLFRRLLLVLLVVLRRFEPSRPILDPGISRVQRNSVARPRLASLSLVTSDLEVLRDLSKCAFFLPGLLK